MTSMFWKLKRPIAYTNFLVSEVYIQLLKVATFLLCNATIPRVACIAFFGLHK